MTSKAFNTIGIDLGTTFSAMAFIDSFGRPTTIPNSNGNSTTPSVVLFGTDGIIVGEEAVQAATMEADRVAECAKRDMGSRHFRKSLGGQNLPPEVISSYILKKLKSDAERKLGPVTHAVITVPAYFDERRRQATVNAGKLAGLNVLDILNEPTAAAIAYGFHRGFLKHGNGDAEKAIRILVYDLGGGTFDVTLMEIKGDHFQTLATDGDVKLGGRDWDEKLVNLIAERFIREHREDPRQNQESLYELYRAAETAKRTLSEREQALVVISHVGTRFKTTVTRADFEAATATLLNRTRITTEIVLQHSKLAWKDIDRVLLVGGSSRMPMVAKMLQQVTGQEPDRSVSPDDAVAQGAALFAELAIQKRGLGTAHNQFSVTNVNSHSLGIIGIRPETGQRVSKVVIPKNSPLPAMVKMKFTTHRPNQQSVLVTVVEGESEDPEACAPVGQFMVQELPPGLPAKWPIQIVYQYSENGCLKVSAKVAGQEKAATTEFVRDNSLSDDDLMVWGQRLQTNNDPLSL